eukprot:CAMPEP_0118914976 /NCGR_PEP_ID=MMETSP1166-20130328/15216_1 /TAXON_ID=1104430 /ORGANISM="Chrysoreinhardia sp, Strain CCMP3193" /LENGTH=449 /DNA_ID=CAMNT_0006854615 /DNA_START=56 /DNA_END=1402 /DNA_ORIENTATION=+
MAPWKARSLMLGIVGGALAVQLWSLWMAAPGRQGALPAPVPKAFPQSAAASPATPRQVTVPAALVAPKKKAKTIAYAISVTKDGSYVDGAAVLAHSAIRAHRGTQSRYGVALVAFVAPSVTSVAQLEVIGYRVLVKELPVQVADIRGQYLRERISTNGCCGAWELLKLYSWTLTEYHRVVHVDMDVAILQNIDELFDDDDDDEYAGGSGSSSKTRWWRTEDGEDDVYALFTYDWTMARGKNKPVQGGFILAKPSTAIYDALVDVVREGDFRANGGWGGTGAGQYWGGMTIQGLMPYFFETVRPGQGKALDECVYNNMAHNPRDVGGFNKGRCRRDGSLHPAPCRDCRLVDVDDVKTVHFTICQKPWNCISATNVACPYCPICAKLHKKWFDIRHEMELEWGTYDPAAYDGTARDRHGMCGRHGASGYKPVPIDRLLANRSLAAAWRASW